MINHIFKETIRHIWHVRHEAPIFGLHARYHARYAYRRTWANLPKSLLLMPHARHARCFFKKHCLFGVFSMFRSPKIRVCWHGAGGGYTA